MKETVKLNSFLKHSNDALLVSDPKGKIIYVNPSIEKVTGLTVEMHLGRNIRELLQDKLINHSATLESLEQRRIVTREVKTVTGESLLNTASPVLDSASNLKYVVSNIRNIKYILQDCKSKTDIYYKDNCLKGLSKLNADLPYNIVDVAEGDYEIVFNSSAMASVVELAIRLGQVDSTVLIYGETGVGKDLIARLIYSCSPRSQSGCFVKVNCGSLPANLVESELFGYEPGAFTGALKRGKIGYFQEADRGVLFLDEIAELPLEAQAKLLDVLQERRVYKVGGTKSRYVDVRILAATNRNLKQMVDEGKFRKDLYYRLNVVPIIVPPLRERPEDVIALVAHFSGKLKDKYNLNKDIEPNLIEYLTNYSWPGNVRELYNLVERLLVTIPHRNVTLPHLFECLSDYSEHAFSKPSSLDVSQALLSSCFTGTLREMVEEFEITIVRKAVEHSKNHAEAAKKLGISLSSLTRRLRRYKELKRSK